MAWAHSINQRESGGEGKEEWERRRRRWALGLGFLKLCERFVSYSFNTIHIFSVQRRADKTNKALLQAASFLSTTIKLFHSSRFFFFQLKSISKILFIISIDFLRLFFSGQMQTRSCQMVSCPTDSV